MVCVIFQRKNSMVLWNSTYVVNIDGKEVTSLRNGETKEVFIPEGSHEVEVYVKKIIGKNKRLLADLSSSKTTMDFSSKKVCIGLISKVGWTNKVSIEKLYEDDSNIVQDAKGVKVYVQLKDSEYMQKRLSVLTQPTYVGVRVDGKDVSIVKNLDVCEFEVANGTHTISFVNLFKSEVFDERKLNFSSDGSRIYLEVLPRPCRGNSYPFKCSISSIEDSKESNV